MPNPTRKHTRSRQGKRRANWKLILPMLTACPQCARPVLMHHVCLSCGFYRGRQVVRIREKKKKNKDSAS